MTKLGDRAKDKITGFCGIVTARTVWLNGCVRVGVQSEELKDGLPGEVQWIDEPQLVVVNPEVIKPGYDSPLGGPTPIPKRAPDPRH